MSEPRAPESRPSPAPPAGPAPAAAPEPARAARLAGYLGFYLLLFNLFACLYRGVWGDFAALLVSGGGLILLGAGIVVHRRRLRELFSARRLRLGANVTLAGSLFVAAVVLANWFAARHPAALDLTRGGAFTLQPRTVALLRELPERLAALPGPSPRPAAVEVLAVLGRPRAGGLYLRRRVLQTLELYASESPAFRLEELDPDREYDRARQAAERLGLSEKELEGVHLVLGSGQRSLGWDELCPVDARSGRYFFAAEEALTAALEGLLDPRPETVGFLTGHEERGFAAGEEYLSLFALGARLRRQEHCSLRQVRLGRGALGGLDECDVLVVAGPRLPFTAGEAAELRAWLEQPGGGGAGGAETPGRGLLVGLDPQREGPCGLEGLLARAGLEVRTDRIVLARVQRRVAGEAVDHEFPARVAPEAAGRTGAHPILRYFDPGQYFYVVGAVPLRALPARALPTPAATALPPARVTPLLYGPDGAWGTSYADYLKSIDRPEAPGTRAPAPAASPGGRLLMAAAAEYDLDRPAELLREPATARLVVLADADFPTDRAARASPENLHLTLAALRWLARREAAPLFITRAEREPKIVFLPGEARRVFWGLVVGPALIALVLAVMAWLLRRR